MKVLSEVVHTVWSYDGKNDLYAGCRRQPPVDGVEDDPDENTDEYPHKDNEEKADGGLLKMELPGDYRCQGEAKHEQRRGIVEQTFTFGNAQEGFGHVHPTHDGRCGNSVGRRNDAS